MVTIVRNVLILFFSGHMVACLFYFIARQTPGTNWVSEAESFFSQGAATTTFELYIYSLYFAVVTAATVG